MSIPTENACAGHSSGGSGSSSGHSSGGSGGGHSGSGSGECGFFNYSEEVSSLLVASQVTPAAALVSGHLNEAFFAKGISN